MCVKQQEIYIERKKQRHDESLQQMTRAERDRKIREDKGERGGFEADHGCTEGAQGWAL